MATPSPDEHYTTTMTILILRDRAIEALKDIFLLARCDYLVYPRGSTFSYLARCIGAFSDQNLVDVERYDLIVRAKRTMHSWL